MNTDTKQRAENILKKLTLEEKVKLVSGKDHWHTEPIERLGIPSLMMTDGPHGLRKELPSDGILINTSETATCFPTAVGMGATFDTELIARVGAAIAEEAKLQGISCVLGPGINIKRSPLCGRNFEYFSEDPIVSGECGAAMIKGIQSRGVSACVKHYALNSQETMRLVSNSCADERTIRELYTANFERAVKKGKPGMLMTSYNLVNNEYVGESASFLDKMLRNEWGYDGLVVSDWAAVNDRVRGIKAGLDLEMPGKASCTSRDVFAALENGQLKEWELDACAKKVIEFVLKYGEQPEKPADSVYKKNIALAREAAGKSCVLLKNNGILPLDTNKKIAVIGHMAEHPRYQGAGSSRVKPYCTQSLLSELDALEMPYSYAAGCNADGSTNEKLIAEAVETARSAEVVVAVLGLPDVYESEGYDRTDMRLPEGMLLLLTALSSANKSVVVALQLGSPVELPFRDSVAAILVAYLGGEASGGGLADVLTGRVNPSAKLAETFPEKYADLPCKDWYAAKSHFTEYREGVYIGYRYYDALSLPVAYPFGHGLSYTSFALSDADVNPNTALAVSDVLTVKVRVKNTGARDGAETVLVYVRAKGSPEKRLVSFAKVALAAGESTVCEIAAEARDFANYDVENGKFVLPDGKYELFICGTDNELVLPITLVGRKQPFAPYITPSYNMQTPDELFHSLIGFVPQEPPVKPFTRNSTVGEVKRTGVGKLLYSFALKMSLGSDQDETARNMAERSMLEMPLRALGSFSNGMLLRNRVDGLVTMANGQFFKGLFLFLKKDKPF